jgi:hypothetical protein
VRAFRLRFTARKCRLAHAAVNACSRSAMMSSRSSVPTEMRTVSGPARPSSSGRQSVAGALRQSEETLQNPAVEVRENPWRPRSRNIRVSLQDRRAPAGPCGRTSPLDAAATSARCFFERRRSVITRAFASGFALFQTTRSVKLIGHPRRSGRAPGAVPRRRKG